ncbi:hypothetical protein ANCCAN_04881 [Ancylostoma caninum]|uniref:Uncharacterized protein n=1 Tax=Ancylostoma caninum TaxID=29170 RepID=A0A368GXF5_ANCCA|nr:hypothetical protein ANCCAN_04881 [Ancylostoma caninum]
MESVDKTLSSTQHLLQAIEEDDSLLDDEYFTQKLEYLRMKHKETSDFLARILQQEECLPPSISTCTCKEGNMSFPSEWSFSGCVSAKLITKSDRQQHTLSEKCTSKRRRQEMARTAFERYNSIEKEAREELARAAFERHSSVEKEAREEMMRAAFEQHNSIEKEVERKKEERDGWKRTKEKPPRAKRSEWKANREQSSKRKQDREESRKGKRGQVESFGETCAEKEIPKEMKVAEKNHEETRDHEHQEEEVGEEKKSVDKLSQGEGSSREKMDEGYQNDTKPNKTKKIRSKSAIEIQEPRKFQTTSASVSKREVVPEPVQNFVPQITVPRPFKMSTRKPILNTYSTKFVEEMVSKKKQEEEELENQASKSKPFTAHTVPLSTYIPTNPRVMDSAYIEVTAIRKRLTANLRKHFQEEALLRKSKSLGDIRSIARPVPLSTYVPPAQLPDYRRARSAGRRSVKLLVDSKSPPLNNEHAIRSNVSTKVRHILCIEGCKEPKHPRPPVPDFSRLHAEVSY